MNSVFSFGIGVIVLAGALWMLKPSVSTRIRNSRFWVVGWLGYLFALSIAAKLMFPLYASANVDDDKAIPVLFGVMVVLLIGTWFRAMYDLRKQTRHLRKG